MTKWMTLSIGLALLGGNIMAKTSEDLDYGQFSVSLRVDDIQKSYEFYSTLGFKEISGDITNKWVILSNKSSVIGLFEGMIEGNSLTFNPLDVRNIHRTLKAKGIKFEKEPEGGSGPAHAVLKDPDNNVILLDQH